MGIYIMSLLYNAAESDKMLYSSWKQLWSGDIFTLLVYFGSLVMNIVKKSVV